MSPPPSTERGGVYGKTPIRTSPAMARLHIIRFGPSTLLCPLARTDCNELAVGKVRLQDDKMTKGGARREGTGRHQRHEVVSAS